MLTSYDFYRIIEGHYIQYPRTWTPAMDIVTRPVILGQTYPLSRSWLMAWHTWIHHDDVIKWKHFPRYWPFVRGIRRSPVNSPHNGQWCGALIFSLICAWINGWVNTGEAGDLRRHRAHHDVTGMMFTWNFANHRWNEVYTYSKMKRVFPNLLYRTLYIIPPVTGEFPSQRPVTRCFDVFFDLRLNKRLSKQSWGWWFETPSRSLWRHCNEYACGIGGYELLCTTKNHFAQLKIIWQDYNKQNQNDWCSFI